MDSIEILSTRIHVTNMDEVVEYIRKNIERLRGKYICITNVHTIVMSYEDNKYRSIQNNAALTLPDGKPLVALSRRNGFPDAERVAGPDLMQRMFEIVDGNTNLKHFFFGGSQETLELLRKSLQSKHIGISIAGMYSPPMRPVELFEVPTWDYMEEDEEEIEKINATNPDIVWVGLGAPKQEIWMANHIDRINAVMIGVGAGFDFHAGTIKRAPKWMQKASLEWLYRLSQDPKRLWKRYFRTNLKFMWLVLTGKADKRI